LNESGSLNTNAFVSQKITWATKPFWKRMGMEALRPSCVRNKMFLTTIIQVFHVQKMKNNFVSI